MDEKEKTKVAVRDTLEDLLKGLLAELGADLEAAGEELLVYSRDQAQNLEPLIGTSDFDAGVIAARDNVLMKAGLLATQQAENLDKKIMTALVGVLTVLAAAL